MVSTSLTIRKIYINNTLWNKTLHLFIDINNYVVEGIIDIEASMSIMATTVVRKFNIMHLVTGFKTYKIAFGIVTQAMGKIDEVLVKVACVQCTMTFKVVNIDNYDTLFGLDFLIKIGAIMDVERGLIQMKHGPGANVEVLPLTMVNMSSKVVIHDVIATLENIQIIGDSYMIIRISYQYNSIIPKGVDVHVLDSNIDTNNNENCDEGSHQVE